MVPKAQSLLPGPAGLLASLQQADSFFPGGAMAFSWGLEGLFHDGLIHDATSLSDFVRTQMLARWASFDQGILAAAWQAGDDFLAWQEVDAMAEAMTLPESLRAGSRRLGRTLVEVHARCDNRAARELLGHIRDKAVAGHLAAVQGYLWQSMAIGLDAARAISAHTTVTTTVSAAVRLGIIGHLDAQRILTGMRAPLAAVLAGPAPALHEISSSAFAADIAAMRGSQRDARLFTN